MTKIAAKWRMYSQRKKFRALRDAADVFAANYKRLRMQRYVKEYRGAVGVVRKFIIGFMNRHKPKCAENIYVCVGVACYREGGGGACYTEKGGLL